jgi:hypothetical protein
MFELGYDGDLEEAREQREERRRAKRLAVLDQVCGAMKLNRATLLSLPVPAVARMIREVTKQPVDESQLKVMLAECVEDQRGGS